MTAAQHALEAQRWCRAISDLVTDPATPLSAAVGRKMAGLMAKAQNAARRCVTAPDFRVSIDEEAQSFLLGMAGADDVDSLSPEPIRAAMGEVREELSR